MFIIQSAREGSNECLQILHLGTPGLTLDLSKIIEDNVSQKVKYRQFSENWADEFAFILPHYTNLTTVFNFPNYNRCMQSWPLACCHFAKMAPGQVPWTLAYMFNEQSCCFCLGQCLHMCDFIVKCVFL